MRALFYRQKPTDCIISIQRLHDIIIIFETFLSVSFSTSFLIDEGIQPCLEQIDQVEESVAQLEQTAYQLDAYSKRLGK